MAKRGHPYKRLPSPEAARAWHDRMLEWMELSDVEEIFGGRLTTMHILAELRDWLRERLDTNQLKLEEIQGVLLRHGLANGMSSIRWQLYGPRRSLPGAAPKPAARVREFNVLQFDFKVRSIVEVLGIENVDPRFAQRYAELIGQLPWGAYQDIAIETIRAEMKAAHEPDGGWRAEPGKQTKSDVRAAGTGEDPPNSV